MDKKGEELIKNLDKVNEHAKRVLELSQTQEFPKLEPLPTQARINELEASNTRLREHLNILIQCNLFDIIESRRNARHFINNLKDES